MRANSNFLASSVVVRLRLGWLVIAVLLAAVVWTSVKGLINLQRAQHALGDQVVPVMAQVEHITRYLPEVRAALTEWSVVPDVETHAVWERRTFDAVEALLEGLPKTSAFLQVESDLRLSLAELDRLGRAASESPANVMMLGPHSTGSQIAVRRRLAFAKANKLLNRTEAISATSAALAKDRMREAAQSIDDRVAATTTRLLVLSGVVVLAIGFNLFLIVERQLIRRLGRLKCGVKEWASGKDGWDVRVEGPDELGEMATALTVIQEQSAELQRSNEELGRFAYTASHDLKSPLRAIHDLAEWTIEDEGAALSNGGRRKLRLLLHRAQRLNSLLDSLIEYSRVGRRTGVKHVDLHWMVQDILDLLGAGDRFTLHTVGAFQNVRTFEVPLRLVLQNFIDNTVKHHDRDRGEITVSFQRTGDRLFISVSDDGPGISPEYHAQVFELFKTLQSRDKIEGSGMGLAIVRKQVEQFGGTLTLVSDPEKQRGTRFSFDWPLNEGCEQVDQAA